MQPAAHLICGVILAGGQSRRMAYKDKSRITLAGKPLLAHVIGTMNQQVKHLGLSANQDNYHSLAQFKLPVIKDTLPHMGPLCGLLSALHWLRQNHHSCQWLAISSCDSPFIPTNFTERLFLSAQNNQSLIAYARSQEQDHYAHSLWHQSLLEKVRSKLENNELSLRSMIQSVPSCVVDFEHEHTLPPFFNINTPTDLTRAEHWLEAKHR